MVAYIEPQVNKSTNAPDNVELPFETNVVNSTESPIINESTISSVRLFGIFFIILQL